MTQHDVPSYSTPSMLSAAAVVAAERFGMPVLDEKRSALIAALHSLINWIIEHPDVPVPHLVDLAHHPVYAGTVISPEDLHELANRLGGAVGSSEGGLQTWVTTEICNPREHGALVKLHIFGGDGPAAHNRRL